jgi:hypothetical protein
LLPDRVDPLEPPRPLFLVPLLPPPDRVPDVRAAPDVPLPEALAVPDARPLAARPLAARAFDVRAFDVRPVDPEPRAEPPPLPPPRALPPDPELPRLAPPFPLPPRGGVGRITSGDSSL